MAAIFTEDQTKAIAGAIGLGTVTGNDLYLWGKRGGTTADANTAPGTVVVHKFELVDAATADYTIVVDEKVEVIDVWCVKTSGAGTTVTMTLKNGSTAITNALALGVADKTRVAVGTIDDAQSVVSAGASLVASVVRTTGDAGMKVFVSCIRRA